ncbi:MAG: hypothetical protein QXK37_05425 [Candidatus Woesearchaeota archaeon]
MSVKCIKRIGKIASVLAMAAGFNLVSPPLETLDKKIKSEATAASFTLAWDPNTEPDIKDYLLQVSATPDPYSAEPPVIVTGTQYTFTNRPDNKTQYFWVRARNTSNLKSGYSNMVSAIKLTSPSNVDLDYPNAILKIDTPTNNSYVNTPSINLRVFGLGNNFKYSLNGSSWTTKSFSNFVGTTTLTLSPGTNIISVSSEYQPLTGCPSPKNSYMITSCTKVSSTSEVRVTLDTTAPQMTIDDKLNFRFSDINYSGATMTVTETGETVALPVSGNLASVLPMSVFSNLKTYNLTISATDRAGNKTTQKWQLTPYQSPLFRSLLITPANFNVGSYASSISLLPGKVLEEIIHGGILTEGMTIDYHPANDTTRLFITTTLPNIDLRPYKYLEALIRAISDNPSVIPKISAQISNTSGGSTTWSSLATIKPSNSFLWYSIPISQWTRNNSNALRFYMLGRGDYDIKQAQFSSLDQTDKNIKFVFLNGFDSLTGFQWDDLISPNYIKITQKTSQAGGLWQVDYAGGRAALFSLYNYMQDWTPIYYIMIKTKRFSTQSGNLSISLLNNGVESNFLSEVPIPSDGYIIFNVSNLARNAQQGITFRTNSSSPISFQIDDMIGVVKGPGYEGVPVIFVPGKPALYTAIKQ